MHCCKMYLIQVQSPALYLYQMGIRTISMNVKETYIRLKVLHRRRAATDRALRARPADMSSGGSGFFCF